MYAELAACWLGSAVMGLVNKIEVIDVDYIFIFRYIFDKVYLALFKCSCALLAINSTTSLNGSFSAGFLII